MIAAGKVACNATLMRVENEGRSEVRSKYVCMHKVQSFSPLSLILNYSFHAFRKYGFCLTQRTVVVFPFSSLLFFPCIKMHPTRVQVMRRRKNSTTNLHFIGTENLLRERPNPFILSSQEGPDKSSYVFFAFALFAFALKSDNNDMDCQRNALELSFL